MAVVCSGPFKDVCTYILKFIPYDKLDLKVALNFPPFCIYESLTYHISNINIKLDYVFFSYPFSDGLMLYFPSYPLETC